VISEEALASYYETAAAAWEKVAFMKARPVAGDVGLGWRTIRAVHPMIYQASMDYAGVRRIKELKEKIGAAHGKAEAGSFNVKLDPGGIRDLEFLAQAMQLLHGGRIPQLRDRSTQRALVALGEVKLLAPESVAELLHAYHFLRRIENRLQMEEERQVHRLPAEAARRLRVARAMGFRGEDPLAAFDAAVAAERERVQAFAGSPAFEERSDAILDLFARHQPRLLALPAMRTMMATLAEQLAREIDASPAPELAMNNLDRFVEGLGARQFYYELLLDRPELVPRLAALFASSRFLSAYLASHPRLIEPVFENPERLLLSREELRDDLAAIRAEIGREEESDFQKELNALRLFHHRQILNVGLLDLGEHVTRAEAEGALTEVAEVTLESALGLARGEQQRVRPAPESVGDAAFLVVGMGKLASRELGYGSDLDLIFLYDVPGPDPAGVAEAQDHFARLTQRLISVLQTPTGEGTCYEIDPRLRPSGRQGSLVTSLASLRRYHERDAQVWERQVLLRARAVAGDAKLAGAFEAARRRILRRPLPEGAAEEIHRIRLRMEAELAEETRERRDLKTGRGGLLDVENAVQYLQLRHGCENDALFDVARVEEQIDRLEKLDLLSAEHAGALGEGWHFLQRLASRLRIVENRSMSELDAERGDLDGLALRLGYPGGGREAGPRRALLRDYARHTEAIRRAYLEILDVAS
jgi:glutamate-ammonia-ligase adenylyltransferase